MSKVYTVFEFFFATADSPIYVAVVAIENEEKMVSLWQKESCKFVRKILSIFMRVSAPSTAQVPRSVLVSCLGWCGAGMCRYR